MYDTVEKTQNTNNTHSIRRTSHKANVQQQCSESSTHDPGIDRPLNFRPLNFNIDFPYGEEAPPLPAQRVQRAAARYSPREQQAPVQQRTAARVRLRHPVQRDGDSDVSPTNIHQAASRGIQTASTTLPYTREIQQSFGRHDISGIRFHNNATASQSARAMSAKAYTTGSHVVANGAISKHTAAHEAAHYIQQQGGVRLKDNIGSVGDKYERHADAVGDVVVRGQSAESLLDRYAGSSPVKGLQRAPSVPVQCQWISRHKGKDTLFRYWKSTDQDEEQYLSGWYKRLDENGEWIKNNIKSGEQDEIADLPTVDEILPNQVTDHTTRYDEDNITADPLTLTARTKIKQESRKESTLETNNPELFEKVKKYGKTLSTPLKTYRWGEYKFEKNYVKNNRFSLGNVNFGSSQYGKGMYVATTPWGSAGYATKEMAPLSKSPFLEALFSLILQG